MQEIIERIVGLQSLDSIQAEVLGVEAFSALGISKLDLATKVAMTVDRLGLWGNFIAVVRFFEGCSIPAQKAIVVIEEYLSEREN